MRSRMRSAARKRMCGLVGVGLAFAVLAAGGQTAGTPRNERLSTPQPRDVAPTRANSSVGILREIRDLHTGVRWLIVRDQHNPAGPGVMMATDESAVLRPEVDSQNRGPSFAIQAGDRLLVEEHTVTADSYLDAIALERAQPGGDVHVRLTLGGKVVRVRAIAAGRAVFTRQEKDQQ